MLKKMKDSSSKPIVFCEQEMEQTELFAFLEGCVGIFTARSPVKETSNEDSAAIVPFDESSGALIVADGMGGHAAGEVASRLAITEVVSSIVEARESDLLLRTGIINGFERANEAVMALGIGSGTTLSVVEIGDGVARTYHAGDSIILIFSSRGTIRLETISHSPVGLGLEAGLLDAEEAAIHEDRHMILNAIGSIDMRIEIGSPVKLAKRDTVVVASDGLSDNLTTAEIVDLMRCGRIHSAAQTLSQRCQSRMNENIQTAKADDLTFICFRQTPCIVRHKDRR